jgi:D-alanyl-D-alanine carboxypeptidase
MTFDLGFPGFLKGQNMKPLLTTTLVILAAIVSSCSKDSPTEPEPTMGEELQTALDDAIASYGGKGVSLAVILPDGQTWIGTAGISTGSTPISPEMLFSIGSATKTFTSAVILQLAEEGVLTLEDSLFEWLPSFQNIDSTITIRQLLNHTNGIFNFTDHPDIWYDILADPYRLWTMEEVINGYVLAPYFTAGSDWHYSNTGYLLLRMIIQEATGQSISSQYRERLFTPTGLTGLFTAVEESPTGPVANGWFDIDNDGDYDDFTNVPHTAFYSAIGGGVFATAEDFALWVKAMWHDRVVLSPDYYDQMMDFHSPTPGEPIVAGYGLGVVWFNPDLFNGLTIYGHSGNPMGYAAGGLYLADYGVCLAILDNTEEGNTMPVINELLTIITMHVSPMTALRGRS